MNNPQTGARVSREASRVRRGKVKLALGVGLVLASLSLAVAVVARRRGARIPLLSNLRDALGGCGARVDKASTV